MLDGPQEWEQEKEEEHKMVMKEMGTNKETKE
jgi:hypothetical protein